MSLAPGTRLGPYEIVALLGAGGMGEVYRARDTRLNREVAIKVSAQKFSERFEREAQTIASLNHANVCHLYDVGPDYLVMELVEGEAPSGPLTFDEALPIIRQLIDGIEAAHDKNIAHRDLKPANIKITPEGVVRILDFGLAKAAATEEAGHPENSPTQNSPTQPMGGTAAGTILGTAAYMAPEQARGKTADKRSDIWSFGVVVYELLTGKRAFEGESVIETLGAVINREPDWSVVPPRALKLLKWCLEKDRKQRLQAIGDARRVLDEPAEIPSAPARKRRIAWLWPAIAAAAVLAAVWFAAVGWGRKPPQQVNVVTFTIDPPTGKLFRAASVSPDGRQVGLMASQSTSGLTNYELLIRGMDDLTLRPIPNTAGFTGFGWSPDGHKMVIRQGNQLKIIDIASGAVQILCTADRPGLWDWGASGIIVFSAIGPEGKTQLFQVPATGGSPQAFLPLDSDRKETSQDSPRFLSDGKKIIYRSTAEKNPGFYVASLDGKERKQLAINGAAVFYLKHPMSGKPYLVSCVGGCQLHSFDTGALQTIGDPIPMPVPFRFSRGADVNAGGLAYLSAAQNLTRSKLVWYSRDGKELGVVAGPGAFSGHELSPDNRKVAWELLTEPDSFADIWTMDLSRGTKQRLTSDPGWEYSVRFWPDGSKIAYMWFRRPARFNLVIQSANGSGSEDLVLEAKTRLFLDDVSTDGAFLLYSQDGPPDTLWVVAAAGNQRQPVLFRRSQGNSVEGRFSPDGRWVAYASSDSGSQEIQVQDFISNAGATQRTRGDLTVVSTAGGREPRWSKDGKDLFYLAPDNTLMVVAVKTAGQFTARKPEKLFHLPVEDLGIYRTPYAVSADSRRFLVAVPEGGGENKVVVVVHWMDLLKEH